MKGQHGPKPVTGPFDTREELESAVAEKLESGHSQKKIAGDFVIAAATVNNIVKKLRADEQHRRAELKRAVLRGNWKTDIPEMENADDPLDCSDVPVGLCACVDGCERTRGVSGAVGYGRSRKRKCPHTVEIEAPFFKNGRPESYSG